MSIPKNCIKKSEITPPLIKNGYEMLRKLVTKATFPNLFKCFKTSATIPISSASCERSFSAMRIKSGENFNNTRQVFKFSLLHIEKGILKQRVNNHSGEVWPEAEETTIYTFCFSILLLSMQLIKFIKIF